ncbi:hypothetical protein RS24_01038 [Candidatus Micropelagos thuwalensis]|uniref:EpsG family protein n=1 Tax=Candidatus Micropelagius thuwalensis TaxID=1397666 RepID=U2WR49_9PROT|nr:hypothetical protein [Candidatus Micropelagos thuwalensis]ERL46055.1 hypothetical protein RS24_01038 [Candidatus Micropelagos thuwalensis]
MINLSHVLASFSKFFQYYLFALILLTLSPFGVLSGNEEMYYGLAKKFLDTSWNGEYSSFIFSGDYRMISDSLIGSMVIKIGFENTQIIGSFLASLLFSHAIYKLCKTLELSNLYGLLSIIIFVLLGQSFIGREWLFEDFEAKIFAYYFVILGVNHYLKNNLKLMVMFLAIATYFHLLVGAQWIALLALAILIYDGKFRIPTLVMSGYFLLCCPILLVAISGFYGSGFIQGDDTPSPSYIYSYIRQYKMVLPFYSLPRFILQWLPGITIFLGILISFWAIKREPSGHIYQRLRILALSSIILILVFYWCRFLIGTVLSLNYIPTALLAYCYF